MKKCNVLRIQRMRVAKFQTNLQKIKYGLYLSFLHIKRINNIRYKRYRLSSSERNWQTLEPNDATALIKTHNYLIFLSIWWRSKWLKRDNVCILTHSKYNIEHTSTLRLFWKYWINVSLSNSAAHCLRMTKCLYEGQITQVVLE